MSIQILGVEIQPNPAFCGEKVLITAQIHEEPEPLIFYGTSDGRLVRLKRDLTELYSISLGVPCAGLTVTEHGVYAVFSDRIARLDHQLTGVQQWHTGQFLPRIFFDQSGNLYANRKDGLVRYNSMLEEQGVGEVYGAVSLAEFPEAGGLVACDVSGMLYLLGENLQILSVGTALQEVYGMTLAGGQLHVCGSRQGTGFLCRVDRQLQMTEIFTEFPGGVFGICAGESGLLYIHTAGGHVGQVDPSGGTYEITRTASYLAQPPFLGIASDSLLYVAGNQQPIQAMDPETLELRAQASGTAETLTAFCAL